MGQLLFKRLCNIDFWHEYYLPDVNGTPFFSMSEAERQSVLSETFFNRRYRLGEDLDFVPTEATERKLKDYRIKYANTPQGVVLGCSVKAVTQADNSIRYRPQINIPPDLRLDFQIKLVNTNFPTFTNGRLKTTLPTRYLFTNNDPTGEKTFPFLPLTTRAFDPEREYEPGEVAMFGTRQQANRRTTGTLNANWDPKQLDGAISEADRLLLPMRFHFRLPAPSEELTVTLLDLAGDAIGNPLTLSYDNARTDFTVPLDEVEIAPGDPGFAGQMLQLQLTAPGFSYQRLVVIDDERYEAQSYGTLSVYLRPATGFPLLDDDGFLLTQVAADEQVTSSPRWEVRLEARPTIWRYRSRFGNDLELGTGADLSAVLNEVAGNVETINPVPYRKQPQFFTAQIGGVDNQVLLPNPAPRHFQEVESRFVTDIYIDGITDIIF